MINEESVASGVFDPILLESKSDVYKRLSNLNPNNLWEYMKKIRHEEIDIIKNGELWRSLSKKIQDNVSSLPFHFSEEFLDSHLSYLLNDCSLWLPFFFMQKDNPNFMNKRVELRGLEKLKNAFESGKGVILGQIHSGPFQLLSPILTHLGYDVFQLMGEKDAEIWVNKLFDAYFTSSKRKLFKTATVPETGFMVKAVKALKRNSIVTIPVEISGSDNEPKHKVDFFEKEIYAPDGVLSLSYISKAPVILVLIKSIDNKLIISFEDVYAIKRKEDIPFEVEKLFHSVEEIIKRDMKEWRGWSFINEMFTQKEVSIPKL